MAEVESLCSRIGILNRGELVFLGTVTELTAHIGSRYLVCVRTAQGEFCRYFDGFATNLVHCLSEASYARKICV